MKRRYTTQQVVWKDTRVLIGVLLVAGGLAVGSPPVAGFWLILWGVFFLVAGL